jgi:DNA invertase Pin-like site-specific DNA recombinase
VIYCRVSSEEQVRNNSLQHQETVCKQYCDSHQLSIREIFREEGESAKTDDRTELKRMLTFCERYRNEIVAVVVYRFDRWARNTADHLAIKGLLKQRRIKLLSATEAIAETPEGRMMETMLAAQAQYENDVKSESTSRRMKEVLQRGRWTFQCPLGYLQRGGEIVIDAERGALITDAFELFGTGAFGKREVLRRVTRKGLRTSRNKRLGGQMFGRMLSNPFYAGWIVVPRWDIRQPGTFAPLVSQETFDRVQDVLSGRGVAKRTHRRFRPDFPLRHFLKCSRCGTPLTASWCTSKSGRRYAKYFCRKSDCRGTFAGPTVEDQFRALLRSLSPEPSTLRIMLAATERAWRGKHDEDRQRQGTLNARREQLAEQQRRLVAARFYDSAIDQRTFDTETGD